MKKPLKYLSTILALMVVVGAFSVDSAQAASLYQQLLDGDGSIIHTDTAATDLPTLIGNFTPSVTTRSASTSILMLINNSDAAGINHVIIQIATSTQNITPGNIPSAICQYLAYNDNMQPVTTSGNFYLSATTTDTCNVGAIYDYYYASTTYYVYVYGISPYDAAKLPADYAIKTDRGNQYFYGLITSGEGGTVLVLPGVTGFTNPGISTTSQSVYCASSFATSGFLSQVASDISTAMCNVTVFLFVPSNESLTVFLSLASTTRDRAPFSYFYDMSTDINNLSASSTANLPTYTANLSALGIGSTTPIGNILPNLTLLSSTTILQYAPSGFYSALMFLARASIWLGLGFTLYAIGRKEFHPKHS